MHGAVRDNEDAFRVNVREDIWKNGVRTGTWWISVLDCVDSIAVLVGHPNLTAVGPEAWRHYSWSFNVYAKGPRDLRFSSIPVNPKDVALLARYDHVEAKCAKMVERNPVVVRCEAPRERRKQRDGTYTIDLEDQSAFCGENVARGEPGRRGLRWSDSHVFFPAGTKPRKRREQRDIPVAVDLIDVLGAEFAHEQDPAQRPRPWEGDTRGKGNWIGGVKHSCER